MNDPARCHCATCHRSTFEDAVHPSPLDGSLLCEECLYEAEEEHARLVAADLAWSRAFDGLVSTLVMAARFRRVVETTGEEVRAVA